MLGRVGSLVVEELGDGAEVCERGRKANKAGSHPIPDAEFVGSGQAATVDAGEESAEFLLEMVLVHVPGVRCKPEAKHMKIGWVGRRHRLAINGNVDWAEHQA